MNFFHITEGREKGLDAFAKAPSDVAKVAEKIGFSDAGIWRGLGGRRCTVCTKGSDPAVDCDVAGTSYFPIWFGLLVSVS